MQTAVTAHLHSEQLLLFAFAWRYNYCVERHEYSMFFSQNKTFNYRFIQTVCIGDLKVVSSTV